MTSPKPPKWKHFSPFSTAAEEVSNMKSQQDAETEGSHREGGATKGRIVRTPGEAKAYKVVLEHGDHPDTDHGFDSIREGEEFIRAETPAPPKRHRGRDAPR